MMAAWFRLTYSAVFLVAICRLLEVPALLADGGEQATRVLTAFDATWKVGLTLFAVHLLLLGYLADGFATIVVADFPFSFALFVFGGEVALAFWLLIRGRQTLVTTATGKRCG